MAEKKSNDDNIRKALEEANKYYQHIDNYFWVISSFLILLSISTFTFLAKNNFDKYIIVAIDAIMIIVWFWYRQFHKDSAIKIQYYYRRINCLEKKLSVNFFPDTLDDMNQDMDKNIFPYRIHFLCIRNKTFHWLMIYVTYLFWFLYIAHIIITITK